MHRLNLELHTYVANPFTSYSLLQWVSTEVAYIYIEIIFFIHFDYCFFLIIHRAKKGIASDSQR